MKVLYSYYMCKTELHLENMLMWDKTKVLKVLGVQQVSMHAWHGNSKGSGSMPPGKCLKLGATC